MAQDPEVRPDILISMSSRPLLTALSVLALSSIAQAQPVPGETWERFSSPAEAGFDESKLEEARKAWEGINSSAFLVIYKGAVVADWGETTRRFMCHSVRKSFMSGLYGLYVDKGMIDLNKTLGELGISDFEPDLTETEKKARIVDLLSARSGVYRLAAYEPPQNPKPARGSHAPGTFWNYNNWDFNTLVTIFEQETGERISDAFWNGFAKPLQMQDFQPRHVYYHYELDKSIHPAYPFRMSARDMARFGLLYLNKGKWGNRQILSRKWVEDSTRPQSTPQPNSDYAYLWWNHEIDWGKKLGMYFASGTGNQMIFVVPGADMVIVNRANTFENESTPNQALFDLVRLVIQARTSQAKQRPSLSLMNETEKRKSYDPDLLKNYVGYYKVPDVEIRLEGGELVLHNPSFGTFALEPVSSTEFKLEDANSPIFFELDSSGRAVTLVEENALNAEAYRLLALKEHDKAIAALELALKHYPKSSNLYDSLGEMYMHKGDKDQAIKSYRKSLELNPANTNAEQKLKELAGN